MREISLKRWVLLDDVKKTSILCIFNSLAVYTLSGSLMADQSSIQLLENSRMKDPQIISERLQLEADLEQTKSTRGALLPQFSGSTYTFNTNFSDLDKKEATTLALSLSQSIYSFQLWRDYDLNKKQNQIQRDNIEIAEIDFSLEYYESLTRFLRNKELAEISKSNIKNIKDHTKAIRQRFKSGDVTKTDLFKAQERLNNAVGEQLEFLNLMELAREDFRELTRRDVPENVVLPSLSNLKGWLEKRKPEESQFKENKNIKQLESQVAFNNQNYKRLFAGHYPSISFESQFEKEYTHNDFYETRDEITLGVRVAIPLTDGGRTTYGHFSAYKTLESSRSELRKLKQQIQRNYRKSMVTIDFKERLLATYNESLRLSKKAIKGIVLEFMSGTKTSFDVLEAKRDLYNINRNIITNKYDLKIEQFRLLKELGKLDPDTIRWLK